MAFTDLREFVARLEKRRPPAPRDRARLPRPRDHRDRRPRVQDARRGQRRAAVRARRGLRHAGAGQRVRLRGAHGDGARRRAAGRAGRAHRQAARRADARHVRRAAAQARHADRRRPRGAPDASIRRPARRSSRRRRPRWPACRSCSAGPATADATSRCPPCSRAIPLTGARNVGMYRLQVFDDRTLGMHWQTHKGGAEHEHRADRAACRWPSRSAAIPP